MYMMQNVQNTFQAMPLFDTNFDSFHIEDIEVTLLIENDIKLEGSHMYENMLPLHIHPHYELFVAESGILRVLIQDKEELLGTNDLIIIPPRVEHISIATTADTSRYSIRYHIKKNMIQVATSLFHTLDAAMSPPYVLLRNCPMLLSTIKSLQKCMLDGDKLYTSYYFHEFIVHLISHTSILAEQKQKKPIHLENNIMRYHMVSSFVNSNFKDTVTLEYIAKYLNLSVRQTKRIIKQCYGLPFSELIFENKMRYAANLLSNTSLTIAEISSQAGYSSPRGFYHSFKKKYNCSPSEYRRLHSVGITSNKENGNVL